MVLVENIDSTYFNKMVEAFDKAIHELTQENVRAFYIAERDFEIKQGHYTIGMENERRIMARDIRSIIPSNWVK